MPDLTPERIAAALALAEAACEWDEGIHPSWCRVQPLCQAYRATAPKLRTRRQTERASAAEDRVAELEREVVALQHAWERRIEFVRVQHAPALGQAMGLLEAALSQARKVMVYGLDGRILRWLDAMRAKGHTALDDEPECAEKEQGT